MIAEEHNKPPSPNNNTTPIEISEEEMEAEDQLEVLEDDESQESAEFQDAEENITGVEGNGNENETEGDLEIEELQLSSNEFTALNSHLDQIQSALDNIESKNDDIHKELLLLLEANREVRREFEGENIEEKQAALDEAERRKETRDKIFEYDFDKIMGDGTRESISVGELIDLTMGAYIKEKLSENAQNANNANKPSTSSGSATNTGTDKTQNLHEIIEEDSSEYSISESFSGESGENLKVDISDN